MASTSGEAEAIPALANTDISTPLQPTIIFVVNDILNHLPTPPRTFSEVSSLVGSDVFAEPLGCNSKSS
jgi:hypothetical protein